MTLKHLKFHLAAVYIIFAVLFFIFYHFTKLVPTPVEFGFIILNFIFGVLFILLNLKDIKYSLFITFGLFFTIFADMFLIILKSRGIFAFWGVFFFSAAQVCYAIYLHIKNNMKPFKLYSVIKSVSVRVVPFILITAALFLFCGDWNIFTDNKALVLLTSLYVVLSLSNIIFGFVNCKRSLLLGIGLLLLFICDSFVFFDFLKISTPFNFVWLFYIPSQAFIVLQTNGFTINKK